MARAEADGLRDAYLACFVHGWEKMMRESGDGGPAPGKVHAFFKDCGGRLEDLRSSVLAVAESREFEPLNGRAQPNHSSQLPQAHGTGGVLNGCLAGPMNLPSPPGPVPPGPLSQQDSSSDSGWGQPDASPVVRIAEFADRPKASNQRPGPVQNSFTRRRLLPEAPTAQPSQTALNGSASTETFPQRQVKKEPKEEAKEEDKEEAKEEDKEEAKEEKPRSEAWPEPRSDQGSVGKAVPWGPLPPELPPVSVPGLGRGIDPKHCSSRFRTAGLTDADLPPMASPEPPPSDGVPDEPKNPTAPSPVPDPTPVPKPQSAPQPQPALLPSFFRFSQVTPIPGESTFSQVGVGGPVKPVQSPTPVEVGPRWANSVERAPVPQKKWSQRTETCELVSEFERPADLAAMDLPDQRSKPLNVLPVQSSANSLPTPVQRGTAHASAKANVNLYLRRDFQFGQFGGRREEVTAEGRVVGSGEGASGGTVSGGGPRSGAAVSKEGSGVPTEAAKDSADCLRIRAPPASSMGSTDLDDDDVYATACSASDDAMSQLSVGSTTVFKPHTATVDKVLLWMDRDEHQLRDPGPDFPAEGSASFSPPAITSDNLVPGTSIPVQVLDASSPLELDLLEISKVSALADLRRRLCKTVQSKDQGKVNLELDQSGLCYPVVVELGPGELARGRVASGVPFRRKNTLRLVELVDEGGWAWRRLGQMWPLPPELLEERPLCFRASLCAVSGAQLSQAEVEGFKRDVAAAQRTAKDRGQCLVAEVVDSAGLPGRHAVHLYFQGGERLARMWQRSLPKRVKTTRPAKLVHQHLPSWLLIQRDFPVPSAPRVFAVGRKAGGRRGRDSAWDRSGDSQSVSDASVDELPAQALSVDAFRGPARPPPTGASLRYVPPPIRPPRRPHRSAFVVPQDPPLPPDTFQRPNPHSTFTPLHAHRTDKHSC